MRLNASIATLAICCLLAAASAAGADGKGKKLYRWTDENGDVHYTDQLPPSAAKAQREQLNDQGITIKRVERAMTPEERVIFEAEEAKRAEEQRRLDEIAKMDAVLMGSYPTEADLARSYKERFDLLEQTLESARVGIRNQEKSMGEMLAHAANLERDGRKVPENVVQSINITRKQVDEQRDYLALRAAARKALQFEYDALLARYRELSAGKVPGGDSAASN
jgi:hypothetical protein